MASYSSHDASPSLSGRLMSVAAEYEMQTRRERQRLEDKIADLKAVNADLEQQNWQVLCSVHVQLLFSCCLLGSRALGHGIALPGLICRPTCPPQESIFNILLSVHVGSVEYLFDRVNGVCPTVPSLDRCLLPGRRTAS